MLPTATTSLSPEDRTKLSLLFRTRGDAVSFATLREEDPLETLAWLSRPHIKPWHDAIRAAHREHEQTETHLALARALKDITRILDLEADSTLRIRAVNAIIRLANAIHRANRATDFASSCPQPQSSAAKSVRTTSGAVELRRAYDNAETAALKLTTHLERLARHDDALQDAKATLGASKLPPTDRPPMPIRSIPPISPLRPRPRIRPIRPTDPIGPASRATPHRQLTARAGTPRPPPDRPRKRRHHR